ncbi:hypothetical protein [Sediminimonas sp.]|uniref:Flp family type IVb pilin n=1 Tax=Sediminimonas sp. TaxID=2823379 RepID=UPI0025F4B13B|nr:hypothetical protein [Sediminimonas sp.]
MRKLFQKFRRTEEGAVTVDWVVLCALVVTLLAAGYGNLKTATLDLSTGTRDYMSTATF